MKIHQRLDRSYQRQSTCSIPTHCTSVLLSRRCLYNCDHHHYTYKPVQCLRRHRLFICNNALDHHENCVSCILLLPLPPAILVTLSIHSRGSKSHNYLTTSCNNCLASGGLPILITNWSFCVPLFPLWILHIYFHMIKWSDAKLGQLWWANSNSEWHHALFPLSCKWLSIHMHCKCICMYGDSARNGENIQAIFIHTYYIYLLWIGIK